MAADKAAGKLLTRKEVAAMWRVDVSTIRRWENLGRIKPIRILGTVRFTRAEVIRAAEKYEHGDPDPKHDPAMG